MDLLWFLISKFWSEYLFLTIGQDYNSGHCILALAMKQVLLHEVSHVYFERWLVCSVISEIIFAVPNDSIQD